ncbi:MAG: hypothetical protein JNM22_01680, partial [Saprospiraceae bacterium]|nr:hypothetical protein [Saprospiraceae bacterium]
YSRKKVTYYDPNTHNGDLTLHHKDEAYSFQNEYRILISPTKNEPVKVKLAGLNKISIVIDTKDIENLRVEITE